MVAPKKNDGSAIPILVAENDEFLGQMYRSKFTKAGYEVTLVKDGEAALDFILKEKPKFVLLDLIMPKRDGFYVLEEMGKNKLCNKIPVIVNSSLTQPEDIEKVKALGARDYVVKSEITIEELLAKISTLIHL